jgi:hypothetical protein
MKIELNKIFFDYDGDKEILAEIYYADGSIETERVSNCFGTNFESWCSISAEKFEEIKETLEDENVIDCKFYLNDQELVLAGDECGNIIFTF